MPHHARFQCLVSTRLHTQSLVFSCTFLSVQVTYPLVSGTHIFMCRIDAYLEKISFNSRGGGGMYMLVLDKSVKQSES